MLRRTGYETTAIEQFNQPGPERPGSAVRGVADVRSGERGLRNAADRDHPAVTSELTHEREPSHDLVARRPAIRERRPRVRGDDVPEEDALLEPELGEHAVQDRRRRLRRPLACELALGGERDPGDAGAAVARRLPDEEKVSCGMAREVDHEPIAKQRRPRPLRVLVERRSDTRGCELLDECRRRYDATSVTGSSGQPG